jgi:chemotaxis protein MotB
MSGGKKRPAAESAPVVVVVKKVARHGGHHGGAWKVAYADFVTTMMALFIVLWAAGQDTSVRESIASYFRNPSIVPNVVKGAGVLPASTGVVANADMLANEPTPDREDRLLRETAANIRSEIEKAPDLRPLLEQVQITITEDGLRIQIVEHDENLFFEIGSAQVKPALIRLLAIVGAAIGRIPNRVVIEGHTDSRQYAQYRRGYSNWELSTDRAHSARRILEEDGIRPGQIMRVVGFADHDPLVADNPLDAQNRRVSVLVKRQGGKTGTKAENGGRVEAREGVQRLAATDAPPSTRGAPR